MKLDFEHSPDFPGLSPILRVLLVTDGTVTKTLEAYFGEAIEVDVLEHAERTSEFALSADRHRSGRSHPAPIRQAGRQSHAHGLRRGGKRRGAGGTSHSRCAAN
jgi:hypothetical protein